MHFVTIMVQLLSDMMNKCGHAFRLQVAKKILPRLQVRTRHLHSYLSICTATSASAQPPQHLHSHLSIFSSSAQPPQHLLLLWMKPWLQLLAQDSPPLIKEHVQHLLRTWGSVYGPTAGMLRAAFSIECQSTSCCRRCVL
jgi:hypothetical protein